MTLWPNETRDLIYVTAANHSQLNSAIAGTKKIDHPASRRDNVEMNIGIALLPHRHASVKFVVRHLAEVLSPCPDSEHGQMT